MQQLTHLRLQADQARLAVVLRKETELRQTLQDLAQKRRQRLSAPQNGGDAASVAGADLNWQLWIDQRHTTITADLARTLAEKVELTAMLRRSFGRDQAARQVHKVFQQSEQMTIARRAHYES
ncbi:hypothetical protein QTO30_16270 [Yoonia sp. GPGPB17]|uniref:hypothetical protein n=1 Tax=Yoonia sp. GPGPB17 TaxID=3026147 RepID=UPI0030BE2045